MLLSVLIPCFNERKTVAVIVDRVARVDLSPLRLEIEIVFVDDGSTDGSLDEVKGYIAAHPGLNIKTIANPANRGKGYSIRRALEAASGDFVIIQDADLEYFPEDWPDLLAPLVSGETDVIYGSRMMRPSGPYPGRAIFDLALTLENLALRLCYGSPITDTATCYKAFRMDLLRSLVLRRDGFAFCPEVTCRLLSSGIPIVERPIRYLPRHRLDGKKIKARHLFEAIWEIVLNRMVHGRKKSLQPGCAQVR